MGYLTIIRPFNCMITLISVFVGAWIGTGKTFSPHLILAGMIGFSICAFGNIINDLHDVEIDRINNPNRPLVKGTVNKTIVQVLAIFLFIIPILFSISLGIIPFVLVLITTIILFLYAIHIKKTIIANVTISTIAGFSFLLGGIIVKNPVSALPFLFSFFIHLPREIIKDVTDLKGDKIHCVTSLPIRFGKDRSFLISALSLGILCVLLPIPYITGILTIKYLIVILLCAYPILFYCIFIFCRKPSEKKLFKYSNLLKISMMVGILAMII